MQSAIFSEGMRVSSPRSQARVAQMLLDPPTSAKRRGFRSVAEAGLKGPETKAAVAYLDNFGYFTRSLDDWTDITLGDIVNAFKRFQGLFGLRRSGTIDVPTLRVMSQPRCGCPDFVPGHHPYARTRAWTRAQLNAWRKKGLKVCLVQPLPGLPAQTQLDLIQDGLNSWTRSGNGITATLTNQQSQADIVIGCGRGRANQFDGRNGVLAWAYLPQGDDRQLVMMFDLDEQWSVDPNTGIAYPNVFNHENGHTWGLDHSKVPTALMAPTYAKNVRYPQENDDILRYQARYGRPTGGDGGSTPSTPASRRLVIDIAGGDARVVSFS